MPKIDIPIKRLMQARPKDWIEYLLPERSGELFMEIRPEKVPKAESRMDALWQIGTGTEFIYLHLEPQGYLDVALPARMLRYRADTWEYTMSKGLGTPSIRQIVLFLYPEHDNGVNRLSDNWAEEITLDYGYRVLRAWELEKSIILQQKLISLYPLLPLMREEPGETPEQVLQTTVTAIEEVEERTLRADLFTTVSILAEKRYTASIIRKFIRREMLMDSELLKEWTEEERKEAAEKAAIETSLSIVIDLLEDMFEIVPKHVKDKLQKIQDADILRYLSKKINKAETIEEFEQFLDKAMQ